MADAPAQGQVNDSVTPGLGQNVTQAPPPTAEKVESRTEVVKPPPTPPELPPDKNKLNQDAGDEASPSALVNIHPVKCKPLQSSLL